jgi:glutathione S-transferase
MHYTLHYSPDSANLVIRMALLEMTLPFEAVLVDRRLDEQRSGRFLALNPQGLLPVLIDPSQDQPLFETAAILLHLSERNNALAPTDVAQRGRFLKWLFYLSNTLHADLRGLFYGERYLSDPAALPALRGGLHARVAQHFALLNDEIARHGGPWLLGHELTVCDLYLGVCARWVQLYPRGDTLAPGVLAGLPQLNALLHALQDRPALQQACAQEGIGGAFLTAPQYPEQAAV